MSTGISKVDKLLTMPSDSISEGVIFQNFLGGMLPDPPSAGMLCMPVCFAHYECKHLTSPISTMMTGLVVPPLFKSLDSPLCYMQKQIVASVPYVGVEEYHVMLLQFFHSSAVMFANPDNIFLDICAILLGVLKLTRRS